MRPHVPVLVAVLAAAAATVVLAQPRPRPQRPVHPTVHAPAGTHGDAGLVGNVTNGSTETSDAGELLDAALPMHQVGTGTVIHFPIPEQLARTELPVFVQIRSSAPIDHVSLYYRSVGARRYTELRMNPMGQPFHLGSGYGAQIPCDDVFPPRVEYFVQAIDQSNTPNGSAGSATTPIQLPIVEHRHYPPPSLPGGNLPHTCGTLMAGSVSHDAGASAPAEHGTGDLGDPCHATNDCRHGLRCGSNHACVFESEH